jgi:uncharacterized protein YcbK (DUF882 family)
MLSALLPSSRVRYSTEMHVATSVFVLATIAVQAFYAPAARLDVLPEERHLRFYHTHTGERLDVVYWRNNIYDANALKQLDRFLRDSRTGDIHHFDPHLFDVLFDLTRLVGSRNSEINVICGYRAPQTNDYLRTHTSGVAKQSLHMEAEAIDIRIPGVRTSNLRDAALTLGRGGVGYYAASDFIHVDVGRVRRW